MKELFFNEDKNLMPDYEEWKKKPVWRHSPDGYNNHIKFMMTADSEYHFIPGEHKTINVSEIGYIPKYESYLAIEQVIFLLMNFEPNNEQTQLTFLYHYNLNRKHHIAVSYASLVDMLYLSLIADTLPHKKIES
jgi:hypothetical protein